MNDKKVLRLKKSELLEILVELSEENDRLKEENNTLKKQLEDRRVTISNCGSIAEASLRLHKIFEIAQQAADCYLENVKENYKSNDQEV